MTIWILLGIAAAIALSQLVRADRRHAEAMRKLQELEDSARAAETPEQQERRVYGDADSGMPAWRRQDGTICGDSLERSRGAEVLRPFRLRRNATGVSACFQWLFMEYNGLICRLPVYGIES